MIIRHSSPINSFTKLDRRVFANPNISDGAIRLYGYMCGLKNGANFTDKYIIKAMNISQTVLTRRKKELKDNDLILIDQIAPRVYVVYIGYTNMPARDVKEWWVNNHDDKH